MKIKMLLALSFLFPFVTYSSSEAPLYKIRLKQNPPLSNEIISVLGSQKNISGKIDESNPEYMIIDFEHTDSTNELILQLKSELGENVSVKIVPHQDMAHATQDHGRGR